MEMGGVMENLEKPGTPEWRLIEHARLIETRMLRDMSGQMRRDTEAMKKRARRHLANTEADAAGRRGPLRPELVEAMREVEEQYPLDPTEPEPDIWARGFSIPRGGVTFYPALSLSQLAAARAAAEDQRRRRWEYDADDLDPSRWASGGSAVEASTIKGKPARRARDCHHGNPRGRCRECSGVGRRR